MRKILSFVCAAICAAAIGAAVTPTGSAQASDAGDGPSARADSQLDINDLYVFASPTNPDRTVMILTVCPLAGLMNATTFATKATYTIKADANNDLKEDDIHTFSFSNPDAAGVQNVTVKHKGRGGSFKSKGRTGETFTLRNGSQVTCGLFDDPAFFDLMAHRAGDDFVQATAHNFFKGCNTLAIVVESGNGEFGPNEGLRFWATTARGRKQVDRTGHPALSTFLVNAPRRDTFNAGSPKTDAAAFRAETVVRIASLRNGNYTNVATLVDTLIPDVLPFTLGDTSGYAAGNGRKLDDDVIDFTLAQLTANSLTTDFVGNDSTFLATFPYLAPANP